MCINDEYPYDTKCSAPKVQDIVMGKIPICKLKWNYHCIGLRAMRFKQLKKELTYVHESIMNSLLTFTRLSEIYKTKYKKN